MTTEEQVREHVKRKLHSFTDMLGECRQIVGQLNQLRATAESPRIQALDGMPHGEGGGDALTGIVAELIEMQEKYKAKLRRLYDAMADVEGMLDGLEPMERRLMRCRYIEGMVWEEVCVEMNYSWSQTHRIHASVLAKLVKAEMERLGIQPEPKVIGKVTRVEVSPDGLGLTIEVEKNGV